MRETSLWLLTSISSSLSNAVIVTSNPRPPGTSNLRPTETPPSCQTEMVTSRRPGAVLAASPSRPSRRWPPDSPTSSSSRSTSRNSGRRIGKGLILGQAPNLPFWFREVHPSFS